MDTPLELKEIGARLRKVDMLLMSLAKKRMDLALEVERRKSISLNPAERRIFNFEREIERLKAVSDWAVQNGVNPYFAQSLLYLMINESCKQQMIQLQNRGDSPASHATDEREWLELLDRNLLILTKLWSETYDTYYDKAFFATHSYLDFENSVIDKEIERLPDRKCFVDIGCATGRLTVQLARKFERTVGYDISRDMILKAKQKISTNNELNISFDIADIQGGIPEPSGSVSFVVMNLGTASDIRELPKVLKEVSRVLRPHGRFLFSFYNKEALLYRWDFIPWTTGLAAEINLAKNCLDVHKGNEILSVYAKPYTVDEVLEMIKDGLSVSEVQTYPTVSAIRPNDLFQDQPEVQKPIISIDNALASSNGGAYIVLTGSKTK